jgi:DeoR/GlpR family transcriptional regulator of sugar metabolism
VLSDERRQIILSALALHGAVSVADLSRMVGVSEITIRRDLGALQSAGSLIRSRGGASLKRPRFAESSYLEKSVVAADQKMEIAAVAATLVDHGDSVMLGAGTTTGAMARLLTRKQIMVVTNSLLVAEELFDVGGIDVYVVGGTMRGNIRALFGGEAERAVSRLHFDKIFLSGNGLTAANGLSTPNLHVASFDRAAIEAAGQVIVLVDHTKIGVDLLARTVPTRRIDVLITDGLAPAAEVERLRDAGVDVRVAPPLDAMTVPGMDGA